MTSNKSKSLSNDYEIAALMSSTTGTWTKSSYITERIPTGWFGTDHTKSTLSWNGSSMSITGVSPQGWQGNGIVYSKPIYVAHENTISISMSSLAHSNRMGYMFVYLADSIADKYNAINIWTMNVDSWVSSYDLTYTINKETAIKYNWPPVLYLAIVLMCWYSGETVSGYFIPSVS